MDKLTPVNNIIDNEEEEPRSLTYLEEGMMEMDDKEETSVIAKKCVRDEMMNTNEKEQTTPQGTPRSEIGSNMNMTPPKIGFVQYIQSRAQQ
jgi:hypothetical protein